MKKILLSALVAIVAMTAAAQNKTLVVYHSYTNNVHQVMQEVKSQMNIADADVVRIQPEDKTQKYEANNYAIGTALLNAISAAPNDVNSYPAIDPTNIDFSQYARIIVGTPLWWSQMSAIMQSFLFRNASSMAGKDIYLVVSSASSGISGVEADAKRLLPNSTFVGTSLWVKSSQVSNAASMVANWLTSTGLDQYKVSDSATDISEKSGRRVQVTDGTLTVVYELNKTAGADGLWNILPVTANITKFGGNEQYFIPNPVVNYGAAADNLEIPCPAGTLALYTPWDDVAMFYDDCAQFSGLYFIGTCISGRDNIVNLSGTITMSKVDGTTGIAESIAMPTATQATIFTLDGRRVSEAEMQAGKVYIVRDGNTVRKVMKR